MTTDECVCGHVQDEHDPRSLTWAERVGKTHKSTRCPVCGFYCVWVPKNDDDSDGAAAYDHLRQTAHRQARPEATPAGAA